jgi:hypothetical protein
MTDAELEDYKKTRLAGLLDFYNRRSLSSKRWHRACSIYAIVVTALLSPLIATGVLEGYRTLGGIAAASVVAVTSIMANFKFQENWLSYRRTWDALSREVVRHAAHISPYNEEESRNALLVEHLELLTAAEGESWAIRHAPRKQAKEEEDNQG